MQAYDIATDAPRRGAPEPGGQGWCFGLPPGIAPEQWPLDPLSGFPLMHGFTLLLPEDYRVHGPEIVALSFFATAADQNDGGREARAAGVEAVVDAPGEAPPADAALMPWWQRARAAHPRLHRMRDILDYAYAVVLLTQAEFAGSPCRPPILMDDADLAEEDPPQWLASGSAVAYDEARDCVAEGWSDDPWLVHRPLRWTPRAVDPNAGMAPRESYDGEATESGYRPFFYWEGGVVEAHAWREHDWARGHAANHIGGTMRPVQGVPEFSPFYVEFGEAFGGYNFGAGGKAQLDFRDMKFDWACG